MKKSFLAIISLVIIISSCKKDAPIPSVYIGTWTTKSAQILSYDKTLHKLFIYPDNTGTYFTAGCNFFGDSHYKGDVRIEGNFLSVERKQFEIIKAPYTDSTGVTKLELNSLIFTKTE